VVRVDVLPGGDARDEGAGECAVGGAPLLGEGGPGGGEEGGEGWLGEGGEVGRGFGGGGGGEGRGDGGAPVEDGAEDVEGSRAGGLAGVVYWCFKGEVLLV